MTVRTDYQCERAGMRFLAHLEEYIEAVGAEKAGSDLLGVSLSVIERAHGKPFTLDRIKTLLALYDNSGFQPKSETWQGATRKGISHADS